MVFICASGLVVLPTGNCAGNPMLDLIFLLTGGACFAVAVWYALACESL
jgi:hypothetical protein